MFFLFDRFNRKKNGPNEEADQEVISEITAEIEEANRRIDDEIDAEAAKVARKVKNGLGPGVELIHIGNEPDAREKEKEPLDILGYSNDGTKAYGIYSKDRIHVALFGETGAGKTVTIGQLVYQNILRNEGFMIIDPHGDLAREALAAIPERLKDRVIYISAMNPQWFGKQIKINPLECKDPKDRHIVAMTFVSALKNMYYKSWGDRLEAILRNGANALVEMEGATLWDLSRLISSPKFLAQVIRTISSPSTVNFLQNVLPSYKKDAGTAAYNKIDKILTTPLVAAMFDTQKSSFDMGQAMNDDMFVIVDLSSGMSDDIADFVGSILLNTVYVEAIRRVDIERQDRKPFYLYVDEAHRFSPAELQSLLTTVRKFNVKVTLASQTINNFPVDVQRSFGALCKTVIIFKSDIATAKMFETVMPIAPDELTSLSLNTFAFYSQAQPPVTGVATTKLVLAKNAVVDDWKARAPTDFKAMVKAIAQLCDEATLEFAPEGMAARLMDPSHIALLDIFWPNHGFESYECRRSGEGPVRVGARADELAKILKDFDDKRDCLKFRFGQDDGMFSLDNGNGSVVKIRAIEPSCSTTPLPKLSFACKVVMDCKALEKVLKSVRQVSEHVTLSCSNANASFSGKGDAGEIDKRLEPGMEGLKRLEPAQDPQSAHYTLDYLAKMHSVLKALGSSATLEYSQNMPLRIEYRIAGVGRVHYYQAPRVNE